MWEEELDLLIAKASQLRTEYIVDSNMLGIPTGGVYSSQSMCFTGLRVKTVVANSRKVGDGERRISVEVLGLYKALEQVPAHRGCRTLSRIGGEEGSTLARPLSSQSSACACIYASNIGK